jgi:hypothetical protein
VVRCVLGGGSAALISYRGIDLVKRRLIQRFAPLNEHPFLAIWAFHRCSLARLSIIAIVIMLVELSGRDRVHEPAQGAFDGRRSLRRKT